MTITNIRTEFDQKLGKNENAKKKLKNYNEKKKEHKHKK